MSKLKQSLRYEVAIILLIATLGLVACSSSGPATSYYSVFSATDLQPIRSKSESEKPFSEKALGVALVRLPGYLDNTSIVSVTSGQKVNVSGYHAWAEPLDEAVTRAMAGNLQRLFPQTDVLAFPWDVRMRPDAQLRVQLAKFDGVRGESVSIEARWSVVSFKNKRVLYSDYFDASVVLEDSDYASYVRGLNTLVKQLSESIASERVSRGFIQGFTKESK